MSAPESIILDAVQARVLGVLMEKEATTPDVYPLTLNAITAGCNQKSSREPVMQLDEGRVRDAVEALVAARLVREQGSAGGRVRRFGHRLDSRLFGTLEFSRPERALLCLLMLRGAQTPGELRARSVRLHAFESVDAVEQVLNALARREDGPHVRALPREPGRREVRWMHLFCGESVAPVPSPSREERPSGDAELEDLEARVSALEAAVADLRARLGGK